MPRGFVLQPTYRIEAGRPVVLIYGALEGGGSLLVRDDRQVPHFYVDLADAERAAEMGAHVRDDERRVTLRGGTAVRIEVMTPQDAPPLRDRLVGAGIRCHEADVRFAYRYLIDRGIRGTLEVRGDSRPGDGIDAVFHNPEVVPADWAPRLSVLAFDIETNPRAKRLLSVSLYGCGAAEVLLLTPPGYDCPPRAIPFATERDLLRAFVRRVGELDPDVLTGWNVIDFDLAVLARMAHSLGVAMTIGRGPGTLRLRRSGFAGSPTQALVPGRVVLDGIQLLRGAFVKADSYALGAVAQQVLGRGKIIGGADRAGEILDAFENDRTRLVAYNLDDSKLVLEILERLKLLELAVERGRLTGMPPDRVSASIASFDFVYLSQLGRRGVVAPTVQPSSSSEVQSTGGHVLDPKPGLYHNVLVFDFKSLYPSIIRTFQIDPLGYVERPTEDQDVIVAPNGAAFGREPAILPQLLDELVPRREAAKAAGNGVASQAIKILMNSFYGVLGTPACRFASPALVNAITGFGREILLRSKRRIEHYGYEVLYGDTDSLFVLSGEPGAAAARALGHRLVADLNRELSAHVAETWRVESRLELEFERLYLRLLLPSLRRGTAGARKRYVGLVEEEDGSSRVVFTGLEVVRRDWTELAKQVQRELYARLFSDRPVDAYLREAVRDLRGGCFDDQLIYRKALRKPLNEYRASTPPHVAAARKATTEPRRIVRYVITRDGPEPADERRAEIDHEHYVQKQIRAVAQPVLTQLGLDFDKVIGDNVQYDLF